MRNVLKLVVLSLATAVFAAPIGAVTINVTYIASSEMFANNPTAVAAINQAAADLSAAITSSLAPIDQNVWMNSRTDQQSGQNVDATYSWHYSLQQPGQPEPTPFFQNVPANTIEMFVVGEDLPDPTLGNGGHLGIGFEASYNVGWTTPPGFSNPLLFQQFGPLIDEQESFVEAEFNRGAGPVISTIEGTAEIDLEDTPPSPNAWTDYAVSYGPAFGRLSLDTGANWHYNHNSNVASGKNDLYSVALHEMLHAIGYGSSETWDSQISGTSWNGANVIAEQGSGAGLINLARDHVKEGVMSQRITDGMMQEVVMDPTLTTGKRKYLTTLDLAFLRDLGYSTITPTFGIPGDFNDNGIVDAEDYTVWRDGLGGTYTHLDYAVWKDNFGATSAALLAGSSSTSANVPEPNAVFLLVAGALLAGLWRWATIVGRRNFIP